MNIMSKTLDARINSLNLYVETSIGEYLSLCQGRRSSRTLRSWSS